MERRSGSPGGRRALGVLAASVLAVLTLGCLVSPALGQVPELPELPELPLPDPPDLPIPDPDELPVPQPEDLPIPDPDELPVPDPDDVPLPDPDDLPIPDPDELPVPDQDPEDEPGDGSDTRRHRPGGRAGREVRVGGGGGALPGGGFDPAPLASLAVVRDGTEIDPPNSNNPGSGDDRRGVEALAPYAFPLLLILALAAFLVSHGYFDRKDPKLALGPVDPTDQVLTFD